MTIHSCSAGDEAITCLVPASSASLPKPVSVQRYSTAIAEQQPSCSRCSQGFVALYLGTPSVNWSGCLCAGVGNGGSFAYLSASPKITLAMTGDLVAFDQIRFIRRMAAVLSITEAQVRLSLFCRILARHIRDVG